ncbi:envelope stress response membrane protein PspC [Blastomonas aquatica]|uniref:Phage shock protein C n=1 Tax=Blastomonas aquatica TaxID=1510276 RepID=A0ABQ1J731_9SPHN|nr:envelope stress response membrane protein PspC [Blastomonas aquatica]GGB59436.1 phage shock protein C [Blastomonas aquatica]
MSRLDKYGYNAPAPRKTKFYRDKQNGKFMGVCAGVADYTGIDVVWIRVAAILLTLMTGWAFMGYLAMGFLAEKKPAHLYTDDQDQKFWQGVRQSPTRTARDVKARFREIDRRLADVELFYTAKNTRLADEIESLR